jgi:hypothetical protein
MMVRRVRVTQGVEAALMPIPVEAALMPGPVEAKAEVAHASSERLLGIEGSGKDRYA